MKAQIDEIKQMHRREVDRMESQIDDLKQERDDWKTQASNQTLLLRHEQERQVEPPKRFFGLF